MTGGGRKISILGAGNVGATIAFSLTLSGLCSEILLVDINKEKAEGEALDLIQCAAAVPSVNIRSGSYEDVKDSDVVIVTFGVGRKPGQSRLDLAKINLGIIKSVMPGVAKIAPEALYVIVSNPVDVLTYETIKCTGLPAQRVIGTGTLLDSNRLTQEISAYCGVDVHDVRSYVLGEHGDACMTPWSLCTVAGLPVKEYCKKVMNVGEEELSSELDNIYLGMVKSGSKVIAAKGATFYAIAAATLKLLKAIFSDSGAVMPLSTLLSGEYGANDLCMGVPVLIGSDGVKKVISLPLSAEDESALKQKVASLDATYDSLGIRE